MGSRHQSSCLTDYAARCPVVCVKLAWAMQLELAAGLDRAESGHFFTGGHTLGSWKSVLFLVF
jgi:hypothetical protein